MFPVCKIFKNIAEKAKVLKAPNRYIECKQGMQQFTQNVASLIILPFSNTITNPNYSEQISL